MPPKWSNHDRTSAPQRFLQLPRTRRGHSGGDVHYRAQGRAIAGLLLPPGRHVILEENPCTVRLFNSWIIMNPGGPPTPDKPDISVVDYQPGDTTSIILNLRVADIHACYEEWKAKGAEFVTPPIDRGAEIRCYMRDPDGYLIEVGQSTGLLHGELAAKRPEDLPG